ncbi:MAG: hypothetical protein KKI09_02055 [Spirochaetes bacterium]|nr:hypothetical protein [Spirochaetota bacterium]MBU0954189.1 hypothetical protein [Spirochaetota bacterium]
MKLLINGLGNIGTTLANVLLRYRNELGFSTLYGLKNMPKAWEAVQYELLQEQGLTIITKEQLPAIAQSVDYVFDTTANGGACANKAMYQTWPALKGATAQGSEEQFGKPYMVGWPRVPELPGQLKNRTGAAVAEPAFTTVVSCNTHGILSLLAYLSGGDPDSIQSADFVVVRRSEDLGNHQRHVASNVIARHRGPMGTHHAEDANRVLAAAGLSLRVSSSDITTPDQLMHSVRFSVSFKDGHAPQSRGTPYVAETSCFDANRIFDIGRRYGFQGRLYNHAVVVSNNLLHIDSMVLGWAFVPQEGNTIISTIASMLENLKHPDATNIVNKIRNDLTFSAF